MPVWLISPCAKPAIAAHSVPRKSNRLHALVGMALLALSQASLADPCGAVMCLSTNKTAPEQCKGHVDGYFNIRVYHKHHHYDPGATAAKRYAEVLEHCQDARQEDKDYVQATYGPLEYYPFEYSNAGE